MDYKKIAEDIINHVGGEENIVSVTHCASRLRFVLVDLKKADDQKIKSMEGIIGLVKKGGQYQLVIGEDVGTLYRNIRNIRKGLAQETESTKKGKFNFVGFISGSFSPLLPALTAGAMLRALLALCETFGISTQYPTFIVLQNIANATYAYFPLMLAYSAATKIGANPYMALMLSGIPIQMSAMTGDNLSLFGLKITSLNFASSVVAVLLGVAFLSVIEPIAEKISPKSIRFFLKPLLTIIVVAPVYLIVLGPVGSISSKLIYYAISLLSNGGNWLLVTLLGAFSPLLVMTGMHYAYMPIGGQQFMTLGYETMMFPGMLCANMAQGAAGFAVAFKTKNRKMRQLASSSGFTAVFGITEPVMYGVNLKLKRPFYAVMIGGGAGGLFAGLMGLKAYLMISPGIAGISMFIGKDGIRNILIALGSIAISFVVAFIATLIIGFEDVPESKTGVKEIIEPAKKEENDINLLAIKNQKVFAPFNGRLIALNKVKDPTFSVGIIGQGVAIIPSEGKVSAPFDGEVLSVFKSMHAIGLLSTTGLKLLVHIGIDTVKLKGKYFESHVKMGDQFKTGDLLIEFDIEKLKEEGYDITSPVLVTNTEEYLDVITITEKKVKVTDVIIQTIK